MVYLFTRSYTYDDGVSISSAGGSDVSGHLPAEAIDNDKDSYWENDGATPDLIIDLGVEHDIDSIWFKHDNISTFDLWWSDDGIGWTKENESGRSAPISSVFWQFDFTQRTKRYWKISVTAKIGGGNIQIYEVMIMKAEIFFTDDEAPRRPGVTFSDRIGGSYLMADGSRTSYSGHRAYANIAMEWEYLNEYRHANLYTLYSTPVLRPPITILPREDFPAQIFRCIWESKDFPFDYTTGYTGSGFSGRLEWSEY